MHITQFSDTISDTIMSLRQELIVEEDEAGKVCRRYTCFENSVDILVSVVYCIHIVLKSLTTKTVFVKGRGQVKGPWNV